MKIGIISDTHFRTPGVLWGSYSRSRGGDVLIIAGDLVNYYNNNYEENIGQFLSKWKKVIFILGNHDHYLSDVNETLEKIRFQLKNFSDRVIVLENESVIINNVLFLGSTLWTNMNNENPLTILEYDKRLRNDFIYITNGSSLLKPKDFCSFFSTAKDFIFNSIDNSPQIENVVVVTHHAPSFQSIHPRFKGDDILNFGFASELSDEIIKRPQIKLWVHGHTHAPFNYKIGETRVICNPYNNWYLCQRSNYKIQTVKIGD